MILMIVGYLEVSKGSVYRTGIASVARPSVEHQCEDAEANYSVRPSVTTQSQDLGQKNGDIDPVNFPGPAESLSAIGIFKI